MFEQVMNRARRLQRYHLAGFVAGLVLAITASGAMAQVPADVGPPRHLGVFAVYQANREEGVPNYVTADLLLLSYAMVRRAAIADHEVEVLVPALSRFVDGLREAQAVADAGSEVDKANFDFLDLLTALLYGDNNPVRSERATQELALIDAAQGPQASPLWGRVIDYSQFRPRGRYTQSETLQRYFRSMRYASSALFAVTPSRATGVTPELATRMAQQAVRLARLIEQSDELKAADAMLGEPLEWRFGPPEDLRRDDLLAVAATEPDGLAEALLSRAKAQGRQPRIISGVVDVSQLEAGVSAADVMTGWRLLPARFSVDGAAFQALVWPSTGTYLGGVNDGQDQPFGLGVIGGQAVKAYPSARELMVALGSGGAADWVSVSGEDRFTGYTDAMERVGQLLGEAQGLAAHQQALLRAMLKGEDEAGLVPPHRLTAALAVWTWQRYLNVLYEKQSYTLTGKGLSLFNARSDAALEPATPIYTALAELVAAHRHHTPALVWDKFADVVQQVQAISQVQDADGALDEAQTGFLNRIDKQLLSLVGQTDEPVVVDVHSSPATGHVVEQGVGFARIVRRSGAASARGARLAHYEFKHPIGKRLSDAEWQAMLRSGLVEGNTALEASPSIAPGTGQQSAAGLEPSSEDNAVGDIAR